MEALQRMYGGIPPFMRPFLDAPEMARLRGVGMNCGCEYTSFPLFKGLPPYSRYRHSLGAALIVWRFTVDRKQSLAALFHDIATPVFAHVVDFLRGDHLRQEATEDGTEEILRKSAVITAALGDLGLTADDVKDYHLYPVADNPSPRLSADRLEYTLGNLTGYGFAAFGQARAFYEDLTVAENEFGQPEIAFRHRDTAAAFAFGALRCSRVYVSPEDRYAMQRLSEILGAALEAGVLREEDLYRTETDVIRLLTADPASGGEWERFTKLSEMVRDESAPVGERRVVPAKKRCIDPLVEGAGRVSTLDDAFKRELDLFLAEPQDKWLWAR